LFEGEREVEGEGDRPGVTGGEGKVGQDQRDSGEGRVSAASH